MQRKRILIVCSYDYSLILFRGDLIQYLVAQDFEVFAAAPELSPDVSEKLIALGARPISFHLQRTGINPIKDIRSMFQIRRIIKTYDIDLVFPYTIKPVLYGSFAANLNKVPVISLITGLGFTFSGASRKAKVLQKVTEFLYKISIRNNKMIIFQNSDDHQLFIDRKIIPKNHAFGIVSGSGVNLDKYPYRVNTKTSNNVIFVLVARLIKEKGVDLYISAAENLKKEFPEAEFHIIGLPDKSPSAIPLDRLESLDQKKILVYHGPQKNVAEYLYKSDIFVLPTYYREGIPRSILEALSVGLPVITTDTPGCKETVESGINGWLIEPQSLEALEDAMRSLLENPHKIQEMGMASRDLAKNKFDVDIINKNLISLINEVIN